MSKSLTTQCIRVRAVIIYNNKVLVVRLKNKDWYCFPGGMLEDMETIYACLERETYEELGIKGVPEGIIAMQEVLNKEAHKQALECFITVKNADEYYNNTLTIQQEELDEAVWMDIDSLESIDIRPPYMQDAIKNALQKHFTTTPFYTNYI